MSPFASRFCETKPRSGLISINNEMGGVKRLRNGVRHEETGRRNFPARFSLTQVWVQPTQLLLDVPDLQHPQRLLPNHFWGNWQLRLWNLECTLGSERLWGAAF